MVTEVVSEMIANVWRILVRPGDQVAAGDPLVILESMKMEIPVAAPISGRVVELAVSEGLTVQEGDRIALLEASA